MYITTMSSSASGVLSQSFVGLIRAFGVLRTDATPCGQPMSVSTAHAICELANSGPLNQKELAQRIGLDTSSVSRLIGQLAKRDWAQRSTDPISGDSRVRLVYLTPIGRQVAEQVLTARAERFSRLLDAIDEKKRPQILESLELLIEAADVID